MTQHENTAQPGAARPAQDARHAGLFELIRQHNLAAHHAEAPVVPETPAEAPQKSIAEFAEAARRSLLPQEQAALGISMSFGR